MLLLLLLGSGVSVVSVLEPYCVDNTELLVAGVVVTVALAGITGSESLAANLASVASLAGVAGSEGLAGTVAGSASECD